MFKAECCVNTYGSYKCICPIGMRMNNQGGKKCIDIDECEENLHDCSQNTDSVDQNQIKCLTTICSYLCMTRWV